MRSYVNLMGFVKNHPYFIGIVGKFGKFSLGILCHYAPDSKS